MCGNLLAQAAGPHSAFHGMEDATIMEDVVRGLVFDRHVWRALVGEVLLIAAAEVPLLLIAPRSLRALLAVEHFGGAPSRPQFAPIEQVLFGSADLVFAGGYYRPDHAGWNDVDQVTRLAAYLPTLEPNSWQPANLRTMPELPSDDERLEELEFARQGWPGLVEVYAKAKDNRHILICETD